MRKRPYNSTVRLRHAEETRRHIAQAARELLQTAGYAGMTIEAIAQRAQVSVASVYAIFKSKTGILTELLEQSTFREDYEETVRLALSAADPKIRLELAARIARRIHEAQDEVFDLLRGAGVVAPELATLQRERESLRYERQEQMIASLAGAGRLRPGLSRSMARDLFWMLTGRDVYRMLVRERGWPPGQYESWLARMLAHSLLSPG